MSNCESPKPRKTTQRKTILPVCQGQYLLEAGPSSSPVGLDPSSFFAGAISKCYIECFSADSGAQKFQQGLDILTYRHREGRHELWLEELGKDSPRSWMQGKAGTKKRELSYPAGLAGDMRFMVVYHVPGSVLINFYALFYFILNIALGNRYSRYKHHHSAKEETEIGSGITRASWKAVSGRVKIGIQVY